MERITLNEQALEKNQNEYKGVLLSDIKFPCLVTFYNDKFYGMLNKIQPHGWGTPQYELFYMNPKDLNYTANRAVESTDLAYILKNYGIDFKKGEIIFYDN